MGEIRGFLLMFTDCEACILQNRIAMLFETPETDVQFVTTLSDHSKKQKKTFA